MAAPTSLPIDMPIASSGRDASDVAVSIVPLGDLAELEQAWLDLEHRADCSFFLSWNWIGCWLRVFNIRGYVMEARHESAVVALAILVPARVRRHGWLNVQSLFLNQCGDPDLDVITIEFTGILVDRNYGVPLIDRCLEFICRSDRRAGFTDDWDELVLGGVPEEYRPITERCGMAVNLTALRPSAGVQLDVIRASGRDYLEHLSSNTRYQIRRAIKSYASRGPLAIAAARDVPEALRFLEELKVLHQATWEKRGKPGAFAYSSFVAFHTALIQRSLSTGAVEVLRISAGEQAIGYLYNFVFRDWVGFYLSGFAYEQDAKAKPGLVSHYLCAERYLQAGRKVYDFMAGQNRYKSSLGTPGPTMVTLVLQKPRAKLKLEAALRWCKTAIVDRLQRQQVVPTQTPPDAD